MVAMNSAPPAMRSSSSRRSRSSSSLDPRVRRVAGDLLDAEVAVGDARDLRQVRDGQHLGALREALQCRGDGVCRDASDPGVDLVEDERLPACDCRESQGDPRQLAARSRLGDRGERKAGVRADEERRLVAARRSDLALAELDEKLALPQPERAELGANRFREIVRARRAGGMEVVGERGHPRLRVGHGGRGRLDGIGAAGRLSELALGTRGGGEQFVVGRCAESSTQVG